MPARAAQHPLLSRILSLKIVSSFAASWDPANDLEQVYVCAPGGRQATAVVFAEHRITKERGETLLQQWIEASDPPGTRITDVPFPAATVRTKGRSGVIAFVAPKFLVAVPNELVGDLGRFERTGGLGDPKTEKAALVVIDQPSETLKGTGTPKLPASISQARVHVDLQSHGGAALTLEADSSDPQQASADASHLTSLIDRLTSIRLGILTVRAFKKVDFTTEGSLVKSRVELTKSELEMLLGLIESQLR